MFNRAYYYNITYICILVLTFTLPLSFSARAEEDEHGHEHGAHERAAPVAAEGDARFPKIAERIQEWAPDALVVGIPFHPDGVAHQNTKRARQFANQLRTRTKLVVYEVDERYSTTEAHSMGAADADATSACIILEQFLRSLP